MSPITVIATFAALIIVAALGSLVWFEPMVTSHPWLWTYMIPLAAMGWFFISALLGVPTLALLDLKERSQSSYAIATALVGGGIGAMVGIACGMILWCAVIGGLFYGAIALTIIFGANEKSNNAVKDAPFGR